VGIWESLLQDFFKDKFLQACIYKGIEDNKHHWDFVHNYIYRNKENESFQDRDDTSRWLAETHGNFIAYSLETLNIAEEIKKYLEEEKRKEHIKSRSNSDEFEIEL